MITYTLSFLLLCAGISAVYGALKFEDAPKIKKEIVLTFIYFLAGMLALAVSVWYFSR